MPKFKIYAGVNGVGKSTLFDFQNISDVNFVNCDMILKEMNLDWKSDNDKLISGRIAVQRIRKHFHEMTSFAFETTHLTTYTRNYIKTARFLGYDTEIHFIGSDDISLLLERIKMRVVKGGHGIDEETVRKRYARQFDGLLNAILNVDRAFIYENKDKLKLVAVFENGKMLYIDNSIQWFKEFYEENFLSTMYKE